MKKEKKIPKKEETYWESPQIQQKIIEEAKSIEAYIINQRQNLNNTNTFTTLETLFNLFKSEMSINLSLRNEILKERKLISKNEQNLNDFFAGINKITKSSVTTFQDVLDLILSQVNKFANSKSHFKDVTQSLQSKIQMLENEITESSDKIKELEDAQALNQKHINKLRSKLKSSIAHNKQLCFFLVQSKKKIKHLKAHIKETNNDSTKCQHENRKTNEKNQLKNFDDLILINEKQNDEIQQKEKAIQAKIGEVKELKSQNHQLKEKIKEFISITENMKLQIEQSNSEIEKMKKQMKKSKKLHNAIVQALKEEHKNKIISLENNVESHIIRKIKNIQSEIEIKKQEIIESSNKILENQQHIQELNEVIKQQERAKSKLNDTISGLQQENERLRNIMREKSDLQNNCTQKDFTNTKK